MNKKDKTLSQVFEVPFRSDILWSDIEKLFISLGGEVSNGNGSRIHVKLNGVRAVFHRPHPEKETDKGAIKSVQTFLERAGITL